MTPVMKFGLRIRRGWCRRHYAPTEELREHSISGCVPEGHDPYWSGSKGVIDDESSPGPATGRLLAGGLVISCRIAWRAVEAAILLSGNPKRPLTVERRNLSVSNSVARQEWKSQPEPDAECRA